jgi:hypothetical protein
LIYNALSDGPITSHTEYYEQIRGISSDIDLLRRTFDFVVGKLKLEIEFEADQEYYELENPVKLSLVLKNLTNEELILSNPKGPTIEFIVEGSPQKIDSPIKWSTESESEGSNRINLPPRDKFLLKWSPEFLSEGIYSITARVYIPHYEQLEEFMLHIKYGNPDEVSFAEPYIRDFFAV